MPRTISSEFRISRSLGAEPLRVDVYAGAREVVLRVCGEADFATGPLLADALVLGMASDVSCPLVVLDFEELRFIDAHCLGIIRSARSHLQETGRNLVVRSSAPFTRRVLGICGMDMLVEV